MNPETFKHYMTELEARLDVYDHILSKNRYLAGDVSAPSCLQQGCIDD